MINSYDYFEALDHPEIVIVDIDAGFTNNLSLPCLPDENMYIRILNVMFKLINYNCRHLRTQELINMIKPIQIHRFKIQKTS